MRTLVNKVRRKYYHWRIRRSFEVEAAQMDLRRKWMDKLRPLLLKPLVTPKVKAQVKFESANVHQKVVEKLAKK